MSKLRPLKRFGQNYLIDKNIVRKIISEFNPKKEDKIIEIGPGKGALTGELIKFVDDLLAVEIDKRVYENLSLGFPTAKIINGDFLKLNLNSLTKDGSLRIIGNIPYNITSPILFKLIENHIIINDAMLMVQLEVAKRITAKEKTEDYGILSVLANFYAESKLCFKISPNVFHPKPKVDSAIIHLNFRNNFDHDFDHKLFIQVVKASFGNRRKKLKNSLNNSIFAGVNFNSDEFDFNRRAEELSISEFVTLTNIIKRHTAKS